MKRLFIDMDGVLYKFTASSPEELLSAGRFKNQEPHKNVIDGVRKFIHEYGTEAECYILSSYLPESAYALSEKQEVLDRDLPEIDKAHRLFIPCGKDKKTAVPGGVTKDDFLLDDYTVNLVSWEKEGTGIKLKNEINNTRGSFKGSLISFDRDAISFAELLKSVVLDGCLVRDEKYSAVESISEEMSAIERRFDEPLDLEGVRARAYDDIMFDDYNALNEQFISENDSRSGRKSPRDELAEKFMAILNSDEPMSWMRGWSKSSLQAPFNPVTGTRYRGVNKCILFFRCMSEGYNDPRFLTYKQAKDKGWQVRKGEKSTHIELWKVYDKKTKKTIDLSDKDKILHNISDPEMKKKRAEDFTLYSRTMCVFNASQIEGIEPYKAAQYHEVEKIELADQTLESLKMNMGLKIIFGSDESYYQTGDDSVHLPDREMFYSAEDFYSTAFHECAHASGAATRLDRSIENSFGSGSYAIEELRAEIASTFLCAELGIEMSEEHLENHKAYVSGWLHAISKDRSILYDAINDANKIADYLMNEGEVAEHKLEIENRLSIEASMDISENKDQEFEDEYDVMSPETLDEKIDSFISECQGGLDEYEGPEF